MAKCLDIGNICNLNNNDMAIWQYDLFLIPDKETSNIKLDEEGFIDDEKLWSKYSDKIRSIELIKKYLPESESWSDSLRIYGNIDSNCLEIYYNKEKINSISFRIDFRTDYNLILNNIIKFCKINNLSLIDEELKILPLDESEIIKKIAKSKHVDLYNKFTESNENYNESNVN